MSPIFLYQGVHWHSTPSVGNPSCPSEPHCRAWDICGGSSFSDNTPLTVEKKDELFLQLAGNEAEGGAGVSVKLWEPKSAQVEVTAGRRDSIPEKQTNKQTNNKLGLTQSILHGNLEGV